MDMDSQAAAAPAPATADNKLGKKAAAAHGRQASPPTSGARWLSNDPKPQSTFTNPAEAEGLAQNGCLMANNVAGGSRMFSRHLMVNE